MQAVHSDLRLRPAIAETVPIDNPASTGRRESGHTRVPKEGGTTASPFVSSPMGQTCKGETPSVVMPSTPKRSRMENSRPDWQGTATGSVAGRLSRFIEEWKKITDSPFVLQAVDGYQLEFQSKPPVMSPTEAQDMETALKGGGGGGRGETPKHDGRRNSGADRKRAIEISDGQIGFYSRMFLVPKKDGKLSPVINVKPLNQFLRTPHFSMTTVKDVFQLIQPNDWAVCLDLKDAYFHVPIHPRHHRFLQFIWRGQTYHYRCLPFGLSTSPRTFTRVTKPIVQHLRSDGIRLVFYLDDVLILASSRLKTEAHARQTVNLLERLGFTLNWDKSSLEPAQQFTYLGLCWDTRSMAVSLPEEKRTQWRCAVNSLWDHTRITARTLMRFLGSVTFAAYAVPLARLQARELQMALRKVYKLPRDLLKQVTLPPETQLAILADPAALQQTAETTVPSCPHGDRRVEKGLGSQPSFVNCQRPVAQASAQPTHQLSRNVGGQERAGNIPARAVGQVRGYPDRQQDSCCLPAEGGGDPLPTAVTSGLRDPVVVSQSPHLVAPCLRERDGQHHCRFPVSEQRDTMVPVSGSGGQNLRPVWDTGDRSLRISRDSIAPEVHDVGPGGQSGLRDRASSGSFSSCMPSLPRRWYPQWWTNFGGWRPGCFW